MFRARFNRAAPLFLLSAVIMLLVPAQAQVLDGVPHLINYQGRLTGTDGNPVADGQYPVAFTLWSDSLSTAPADRKWVSPNCTVLVINGLFNWQLGSKEALPPWTMTNTANLWLGIKVGDDPEIAPRTRLASAPYAYKAWQADYAKYADSAGRALSLGKLVEAKVETQITIGKQITITFPTPFDSPPSLAVTAYVQNGQHAGKMAFIQSMAVGNTSATLDLQAWTGAIYQDIGDGYDIQVSWVAAGN